MGLLATGLLPMISEHKRRRWLMLGLDGSAEALSLYSRGKALRMRQTCQILKPKQRRKRRRRLASNPKRVKGSELKQLTRQHHHCRGELNAELANKVMIFVPVIICSQTKRPAGLSQISR